MNHDSNVLAIDELKSRWSCQHEGRLVTLIEVAIRAGQETLKFFGNEKLEIDRKGDDSPVTIADRETERLTRELLLERFPSDAVAGEEFEDADGSSGYAWTVDPIDGTKSFICGVPLYSTLLAVEHEGQPLGGAIVIPALQQAAVAAIGQGCFHSRDFKSWQTARVSECDDLRQAVFVTSEVGSFAERGDSQAFLNLQASCRLARTWGDGYGYLMVATGAADLMIDPICNAWDVAAIMPVVTEAGGRFTDWKGTPTVRGGDGCGTNGKIHEAVLAQLQKP